MTMATRLTQIKDIPDYYSTEDGSVWSTKKSPRYNPTGKLRLVKPRYHKSGYLYYGLFVGEGDDKRRLWLRAHRLVYYTFNGTIPYFDANGNRLDIDHINHNRHDNSLANLRLITHIENCNNKKKKV